MYVVRIYMYIICVCVYVYTPHTHTVPLFLHSQGFIHSATDKRVRVFELFIFGNGQWHTRCIWD